MPFDWFQEPPLLTRDLPGIGGRIRVELEDFEVEEIPAYQPCGQGDHLYLWVEKRGLGAEFFVRTLARRLELPPGEIGMAGLKDRRAVTRQWLSLPAAAEARLHQLDGADGFRVLRVSRHGNKLRPGHLHGNRFSIRIRNPAAAADQALEAILARLHAQGLANFYGPQRFGRERQTLELGLDLIHGRTRGPRGGFLRKLALSAVQSALFNACLAARIADGLFRTVLEGDVLARYPAGGMFVAADLAREQHRFDARDVVHAGPIFGRKMFPARGQAAEREEALLRAAGLARDSFAGFGKLLQGTRRHNAVYVSDLAARRDAGDVCLTFSLPAGSYATILLQEIMKTAAEPDTPTAEG